MTDDDEFQVDTVSLAAFLRAISVLVYYDAAKSPRRKPVWRIDVGASLRALGLTKDQVLKGRWPDGSDERRVKQTIASQMRWATRR